MIRSLVFSVLILLASVADAAIVISSVSPNEGPVTGGTKVTIRGSGFSQVCILCSPPGGATPVVYFGRSLAQSVTFIDSTTLEAVTPPHLPQTTFVEVRQFDGSNPASLTNAFTFTGDPETAFDPILFPVFLPPVNGAFGSRFETIAVVNNGSARSAPTLYGYDTNCYLFSPTTTPFDPVILAEDRQLLTGCSQSVSRVFYLSKGGRMAASLRVRDVSRQERSHGVDVPLVKSTDFSQDRIVLVNVPVDPRFRLTLRVYSLSRDDVIVNIGLRNVTVGIVTYSEYGIAQLPLTPGRSLFEPSYAEFTNFPPRPAGSTMTVTLTTGAMAELPTPPNNAPIWAMISVTNNETQEITTITPQP